MNTTSDKQPAARLIYVYDALCGWCYGFSPVMEAFAAAHPEVPVTVVSGGMMTGERLGPIGEVAPYIKTAYKDVEARTGVEFGKGFLEGILEPGTEVLSSIPPAKALAVARVHVPERQLDFAAALQKAIYHTGMPTTSVEGYGDLAEEFGMDKQAFLAEMESSRTAQMIQEEFESVAAWGISGFPTLIMQVGEKMGIIARGFLPLPQLEQQFAHALPILSE